MIVATKPIYICLMKLMAKIIDSAIPKKGVEKQFRNIIEPII